MRKLTNISVHAIFPHPKSRVLPLFTRFDIHWEQKGNYDTYHEQHKAVLFTFQNVLENQIYSFGLASIDMMHHTAHRDCTHVAFWLGSFFNSEVQVTF